MGKKIIRTALFIRSTEAIIPTLSWLIITLPIWLSPFHPAIVAYFIIAFDLYFLYKSGMTTFFAVLSYAKIKNYQNIDFSKKIKSKKKITHFIIIPNFKEPVYKLESTIDSIASNNFSHRDMILVLAFEEREKNINKKALLLKKKYRKKFKDILTYFHPLNHGEVAGKASNQTFAAKKIEQYVESHHINPKDTILTICDADSHMPKNYFSYLTYEFLKDKERLYHFYWAPVLLYNNFWQLPMFVRMQATLSSIVRLAFLFNKENLIQISTYSVNLWLIQKVGFWDVDIIPEDWHIHLQAFFKFGKKIKTIPLFTIVNGDAVYSGKFGRTLANRYEQEKRWAWGVSDISYFLKKFFVTPKIGYFIKIKKLFFLIETHLFWPTSFFILTISASIPPLINPIFKKTVLGFLLPKLSGLILTISSLMLVFYIYLDIKIRQNIKLKTKLKNLPFLIIQWYLLPLVSFIFSSLPALDAHTRLLLGKKLEYKVTEKV